MAHSETHSAVVQIIAQILGASPEEAAAARRGENDAWDSLKHIEIVLQVEEEFEVQFAEDVLPELDAAASIVAAVERTRGR